jgi:hypothetical protein
MFLFDGTFESTRPRTARMRRRAALYAGSLCTIWVSASAAAESARSSSEAVATPPASQPAPEAPTPAPAPVPSPTPEGPSPGSPAPSDAAASPSSPAPAGAPATPGDPVAATADRQALEAELAAALQQGDDSKPPPPPPAAGPSPLRLLDLAFDLVGAAGGSTASERDLRQLEGGGHDPKNQGFTVQNVELTFAGVVDPFLRGDANIVLQIDQTGETVIELEEAYLTTLDLPGNLQLQAGQFFSSFGRLNPTHPHTWDFVDQPVVNSRFFGPDGLRSPGVQLSWLLPLPFFAEVVLSAQNSQGETATSFRNEPGESVGGRTLVERDVEGADDLLYLTRLRTSFDLAEDLSLVAGLSGAWGPNATGAHTRTAIYGADLYAKWRPLSNDQGWPFVAWQTEAMLRRYDAAQVLGAEGGATATPTTLDDAGLYSQLLWGFARPWVAGVRYDRAFGEAASFALPEGSYDTRQDPLRDSRQRYSAVLSYYPSEFSKLRLQYDYDRAQFLAEGAHSAFLQFEILFGAHGAHKF